LAATHLGDNQLFILQDDASTYGDYVDFLTTYLSLVHVITPDDLVGTPPNGFHHLRGLFPKNIIIPKQFFPTWSVYRTFFSELPLLTNSKSCLPFSYSTVNFDSKLTLLYARIQNSWTNSLQLKENDGYQVEEDFINGGRGHPPKHLKFFLLVF